MANVRSHNPLPQAAETSAVLDMYSAADVKIVIMDATKPAPDTMTELSTIIQRIWHAVY